MAIRSQLAKNLKLARRHAGLTQPVVAMAVDVHPITVSNWERGRSEPDRATVEKLADVYKVDVSDLYFGDLGEYKAESRSPALFAFGRRLRESRENADFSVDEAVEGSPYQARALRNWEDGQSYPEIEMLFFFADRYRVDPAWLFDGRKPVHAQMLAATSDQLPQSVLIARESALLEFARRGAAEWEVVLLRSVLNGETIRKSYRERFGRNPTDTELLEAMQLIARPIANGRRSSEGEIREGMLAELNARIDSAFSGDGKYGPVPLGDYAKNYTDIAAELGKPADPHRFVRRWTERTLSSVRSDIAELFRLCRLFAASKIEDRDRRHSAVLAVESAAKDLRKSLDQVTDLRSLVDIAKGVAASNFEAQDAGMRGEMDGVLRHPLSGDVPSVAPERSAQIEPEPIPAPRGSKSFEEARDAAVQRSAGDKKARKPKGA